MAMIKCRNCGANLLDTANWCPNCGAQIIAMQNTQIQNQIHNQMPQNYIKTKNCKYCNQQIVYTAKTCPYCGKNQKSRFFENFFVLLLIILPFFLAVVALKSIKKPVQKPNKTENVTTSDENKETSTDNRPSENEQENNTKQEEIEIKDKYYVGDIWENKYVSVSFDECGEYVSDNQFIQPASGNKYIYATFTFENIGNSDTTVAYWDFDCYADGYACEGIYVADDAAFSQTLSSGRKIHGSVYFEVPKDAEEIEFEYSPSFWTSEKIVFIYE